MTAGQVDIDLARRTLASEAEALSALAENIGASFAEAAGAVFRCGGNVALTGIGEAGLVARKISATLASTGTRSIFLHPVEALHGNLGRVARGDVIIALSDSGATEEIVRLLDHIQARGAQLIALTGATDSPLARHADITISYGQVKEACPLGLAPTVSTTCMLALGDALAMTVMEMRQFKPEEFASFHPGESPGMKLLKVEEAMTFRRGDRLSLARDDLALGEALDEAEKVDRRTGAMLLVDREGRLSGILTDADLRRELLDHRSCGLLNQPVRQFMTIAPKHLHIGELASKALSILNEYRIDELPVLDDDDRPVGVIDVQDLLGIKTLAED